MQKNIKAVLFDLDGTLIDSMHVWNKIDEDFLGRRGFDVPPDYCHEIGTMSYKDIAEYTIRRFNLNDTPEQLMHEWDEMAIYEYSHNLFLKPFVRDYLSQISKANIMSAVVTSLTSKLYSAVLSNNKITEHFQFVLSTSEAGISKNDPRIYTLAASKLGVKPSECLVFDDLLPAILAAKQAGMTAYGVYDKNSEKFKSAILAQADGYIFDFSQAPAF